MLLKWLETTGTSFYNFARRVDMKPDRLAYLARGQMLPDLGIAFRVQAITKGAVPAASWLGTTLGREVWNTRGVRASKFWRGVGNRRRYAK